MAGNNSLSADTGDVLKMVADISMPDSSFLVSLDVESLYTNIAHDDGLEARDFYLEPKKDALPVEWSRIE